MERMIVERHQWQTIVAYEVPSASRPGHTWHVELVANPAGARAYCECPAAQHGKRCRHVELVERAELGEPVRRQAIVPAATNDDLWGGTMKYTAVYGQSIARVDRARAERLLTGYSGEVKVYRTTGELVGLRWKLSAQERADCADGGQARRTYGYVYDLEDTLAILSNDDLWGPR